MCVRLKESHSRKHMIVKTNKGYVVKSESKGSDGKRKNLGGPYATRAAAVKRLGQVEYFKHK